MTRLPDGSFELCQRSHRLASQNPGACALVQMIACTASAATMSSCLSSLLEGSSMLSYLYLGLTGRPLCC